MGPVGAIEQHGPHLPLALDLILVDAFAAEIGKGLDAYILPAQAMGPGCFRGAVAGCSSSACVNRSPHRRRPPAHLLRPARPTAWHALHDARRQAALGTLRDPDSSAYSYVVTALHLLRGNEDYDSGAVRDTTGHLVLSLPDFAVDTPAFAGQLGPGEREAVRQLLDRRGTTATAPNRYTKVYPNYVGRIAPQDRDMVLSSLMNSLALVGARDGLRTRATALEQAGVHELLIHVKAMRRLRWPHRRCRASLEVLTGCSIRCCQVGVTGSLRRAATAIAPRSATTATDDRRRRGPNDPGQPSLSMAGYRSVSWAATNFGIAKSNI